MAIRVLTFILLTFALNTWAGNGSSGIGTASVLNGFIINKMEDKLLNIKDKIIDIEKNEEIIDVLTLPKEKIDFSALSKATFGRVAGYEYIPTDKKKNNYWVICKKESTCYKLIPLSKNNSKIPSILGSLIEK